MKTKTNFFNKLHGLIIVALLFPFLLTSCEQDGKEIRNPIPSENPVTLTAEAQTKVITVKDLAIIRPENPETDRKEKDRKEKDDNYTLVGNDWIAISWIITTTDRESLKIEVKENTSDKSRTYNLQMFGKPGNATLQITQSGKS